MSKTAWQLLNSHPPALIRLMARRRVKGKTVRAVSLQEIAIASGMPFARVQAIAQSATWEDITVAEAERFILACNFDPLSSADRNRQGAYERSCKNRQTQFAFLRKSPWWATEFLPLIESLKSHRAPSKRRSLAPSI